MYLSFILDVYSRRVVGWSISNNLRTELVVDALAGFGNGRPCDGCDQAILSADIEQELDFEDGRTLRLHDAVTVEFSSLMT